MRKLGVPRGYQHHWKYKGHWYEKKVAPGKWKISFRATKRTKAGRGGPRVGSRILWKINAYQKAVKTGKGEYQTHMYGTKRTVKARMK